MLGPDGSLVQRSCTHKMNARMRTYIRTHVVGHCMKRFETRCNGEGYSALYLAMHKTWNEAERGRRAWDAEAIPLRVYTMLVAAA